MLTVCGKYSFLLSYTRVHDPSVTIDPRTDIHDPSVDSVFEYLDKIPEDVYDKLCWIYDTDNWKKVI